MKAKKGQILILTLIVMALGLIIISPLLSYLDTSLSQYTHGLVRTQAYYVADAMMTNILNDVYAGVYVYDQNISSPYSRNGYMNSSYNVNVSINNSMPFPIPTPVAGNDWIYLDPGVSICNTSSCDPDLLLSSLAFGSTHEFTIYLLGGNQVQINWSFDDEGVCCMWGCDGGAGPCSYHPGGRMWITYPNNGSTIPGTTVCGSATYSAAHLYLNYSVPAGLTGNYTIKFLNDNSYRVSSQNIFCTCSGNETRPSFSARFVGTNDSDYTWVRVGKSAEGGQSTSYQDYMITVTAKSSGNNAKIVSITAFVRHGPGPMGYWLPQTVGIPSWQITYYQ